MLSYCPAVAAVSSLFFPPTKWFLLQGWIGQVLFKCMSVVQDQSTPGLTDGALFRKPASQKSRCGDLVSTSQSRKCDAIAFVLDRQEVCLTSLSDQCNNSAVL